jgi:hypothetical protein
MIVGGTGKFRSGGVHWVPEALVNTVWIIRVNKKLFIIIIIIEESGVFRGKGKRRTPERFCKLASTERNVHVSYQYCNVDGQSVAR